MLEKLKAINWEKDYDQVVFGGNLAQALLDLHATENDPAFDMSLEILEMSTQNSHPYEQAVAFVMPYLVWMCQNTPYPDMRIRYCYSIAGWINAVWSAKLDFGGAFLPTQHTDSLRWRVEIYDAVAIHVDYFCDLLADDDDSVRLSAFAVLRFLSDNYLDILPHLEPCFSSTSDEWVQALSIWYYALFAKRDWQHKKSSVDLLYEWMQSEIDLLRYTATLGRLHFHPARSEDRDVIPDNVLNNLLDYLRVKDSIYETYPLPIQRESQFLLRGVLPFDRKFLNLLRGVSYNQSAPIFWLGLLKSVELSPKDAHLHCRELMRYAFRPVFHNASYEYDVSHRDVKVNTAGFILYQTYPSYDRGRGHLSNPKQKVVIEFIVNCDAFWVHPTNMFSHFYGLPDEREALRELIK